MVSPITTIHLPGLRVIAKKNSKRVGYNRYTGKMFVSSSKAYTLFEKTAKSFFLPTRTFTEPVHVDYRFQMKGKIWSDLDNMEASINDLLEKFGVVSNDRLITSKFSLLEHGYDTFNTVIRVTGIQNSATWLSWIVGS
jgi:Holliday junction resolvase RusA-like endonuclease